MQFTLKNTGTGTLGNIVLSTPTVYFFAPDYTITSAPCPTSLAVGDTCVVTVSFAPSFQAPDPGSVVITDDSSEGPTTVLLSGTGTGPVFVLPFEIFYDGQAPGTTSAPQTATLFNTNEDTSVTFGGVTFSGNAAPDFAVVNNQCGTDVSADSSCTLGVTFKPSTTVPGPRTADLTIASNGAGAPYVSHLTGNGAIRHLPGFTANVLPPNDDDSSTEIPLPFTVNFFTQNFSSLFVNNNGNVTFGEALSEFTPTGLNSDNGGIPIIAAFWADVDTEGFGSDVVTFGTDVVNGHVAFGVDYENVGYYSSETDKLNSFQLILIDRSDTGTGNFDIEFNYDKIQWEAGDVSGGSDGLCTDAGECAAVGYSNGTGDPGTNFQLNGSFTVGALLDNGPATTSLIRNSFGGSMLGRYEFQVRSGAVQPTLTVTETGTGTGTVTSNPAGITCQPTCSASFASGTSITLTATPASGSTFTGWSGATCGGTSTCTFTITAAASVTANFDQSTSNFPLTVSKAGTGTGTVTSNPAGISCGATCSASFTSGQVAVLTATAATGSTFAGWSGAGCTGTGTCSVTMSAAEAVTATFNTSVTNFTLTVTKAGTGSGTVTSSPAGINCGATCSASFTSGQVVVLTATASDGSTFAGWSGAGCTGTGTCSVTMSAAEAVTATFNTAVTNFTLTVTKAGTGTGTVTSNPAGISCGATCSASFTSGQVVVLTATAATGSTFAGWTGAGCTGTGTCSVTMSAAEAVTATFNTSVTNFTLTVTKAGTGTGTVTSSPAGISCGATCSASFASGQVVVLTATAATGSTFAGWSGAGCTGTGTCSVTMSAAEGVTATFNTSSNFTLTVTKAGSGTGTVTSSPAGISCGATCSASFTSGQVVVLTATASDGSTFAGWTGAGCTGTGTCSVTMSAAEGVTATFNTSVTNFTLTVTKAGTGTGTVTSSPAGISCGATCTASFASGTVVALTAMPADGSTFAGWSGAGCTGTGGCSVTMSGAQNVTATFNSNSPVTIGVAPGSPSTVNTTPGSSAVFGLTLTGTAGTTGTVKLGCIVNAPTNAADITCNIVPSSITLTGKATNVAIVVETFCKGAAPGFEPSIPGGLPGGLALLLASVSLCGAMWTFKRRPRWALSFGVLMVIAVGMTACSNLPKSPGGQATPPGAYPLVVTATAPNGATSSVNLVLNVLP